MGFSLKKLAKKAARGIGKMGAVAIKQAIASTPIGAAAMKAAQALKAAGVSTKAARLKIQPLSVRASVEKAARAPRTTINAPGPLGLVKPTSTKKRTVTKVLNFPDLLPTKARKPQARRKAARMPAKARTTASKGKRKAPSGGLDLKAIAIEWRAQGKPGTWQGFIKANPIRKAG